MYSSTTGTSVTSLCETAPMDTHVHFCKNCGHLQTPTFENVEDYYDNDYKILVDSEEEDQLYQMTDGRKVFRSEHQAATLVRAIQLAEDARVLDYGCAKAATIRRLKEARPGIDVHLFDVSDMYLPFWQKLTHPDRWAIYAPRAEWLEGHFDLITSFYSLEHMPEPAASVRTIARMLLPGGRFYAVVPDWQANTADFVVVDHVNHFSAQSLTHMVELAGLEVELISTELHESALVVVARKPLVSAATQVKAAAGLERLSTRVTEVAAYWRDFRDRVQAFERDAQASGLPCAIYGSGFYGTYIATCMVDFAAVQCFLDQNPYRQGKTLMGKPVLAPQQLPDDVQALYVGLNPARARQELDKAEALRHRKLRCFLP